MKNSILVITLLLSTFFCFKVEAQNTIDISSDKGKILLNLKQDGKSYSKTYNNWMDLKEDPKLKLFSKHFQQECLGIELEDGFEFNLENGIHIKSEDLKIDIVGKKKKAPSNFSISIKS